MVSGFGGQNSALTPAINVPSQNITVVDNATSTATSTIESEKLAMIDPDNVEAAVKNYFKDIPIMAEVAKCESHYHQYDANGNIFRGVVNNKDVGVMQINEKYHLEEAEKLGIDIYTVEGNMQFARMLYNQLGTEPWSASSPCWGSSKSDSSDTDTASNTVAKADDTAKLASAYALKDILTNELAIK